MFPDLERVAAIIRETAEAEILPRFKTLAANEIREKRPGDLVTVADIAAEKRLTRQLTDLVPGSRVIGEEAIAGDEALLAAQASDGSVWIVDPVDGTANFAAGRTPFTVVVAYLLDGKTRAGWIHDPCANRTTTAAAGEGAWADGERLQVGKAGALETLAGTINFAAFGREFRERTRVRAKTFHDIRSHRCAGHDFALLTAGRKHFLLYNRLWPWDHAAGVLMHREAGGYSARIDDAPYRPMDRVQGLLCAPDRETWIRIHDFLRAD